MPRGGPHLRQQERSTVEAHYRGKGKEDGLPCQQCCLMDMVGRLAGLYPNKSSYE